MTYVTGCAPLFEIFVCEGDGFGSKRVSSFGAAIVKRIINGCEVDWASGSVFAVLQDHPTYGYLFGVSADWKRIVRCVHISPTDDETDNTDKEARRFEKDARQAVEEFLRQESEGI